MSTVVRFLTLLTIAAAGFSLPVNCAQNALASAPVAIEIPATEQLGVDDVVHEQNAAHTSGATVQHLFDKLPLDCGDSARPSANEQPATFDTQPFVPGYLETTFQLAEESTGVFSPLPALVPIESRAGPPDAPPPKSID